MDSDYRELPNCIKISSDLHLLFRKKRLFFFHNEINCGYCWIRRFPPEQWNIYFTNRIIEKLVKSAYDKSKELLMNYKSWYETYINKSFIYGDFTGKHEINFNFGKIEYNSRFNEKQERLGYPTITSYIGSMHPQYFYPSPCTEDEKLVKAIQEIQYLLNIDREDFFTHFDGEEAAEVDIYHLGIGTLTYHNNDIIRGVFFCIDSKGYDTIYKCLWGVMVKSNKNKFYIKMIKPDIIDVFCGDIHEPIYDAIIPFDTNNKKHIYIDIVSKLYTRIGLYHVDMYHRIAPFKMNRLLEEQKSASSREVKDLNLKHDSVVKDLKSASSREVKDLQQRHQAVVKDLNKDVNNVKKDLRMAENRLRTQRFNMSQEAGGSGAGEQDVFECGICRDDLKNEEDIVVALQNCGHIYHKICIQNWQKRQNNCPFCKQRINGLLQIFL